MLPLLQTHRQTVPSANLDCIPHTVNGQPVHDDRLQQERALYQQRSFPIRTLYPHAHFSATGSYDVHASHRGREHQLRRKTPKGTIDAGYDGSSAKSSSGEPPLKQLALPSQPLNALEYQMASARSHQQSLLIDGSGANLPLPTALWQTPGYVTGPIQAQSFQPSSQHSVVSFASVYQPVIRANEYNVRAFCPPPPTLVGGLPLGQLYWQQGLSAWDYQSVPYASAVSRAAYPAVPHSDFTPNLTTPRFLPASNQILRHTPPGSKSNVQNVSTLNYDNYHSHSDFKDKTLSQAYRHYASLVGYIQANARASISKDSHDADHASSRHLIFPKPPRPRRDNTSLSQNPIYSYTPSRTLPSVNFDQIGAQGHQYAPVQQSNRHVMFAGVDQFRAQQNVSNGFVQLIDSYDAPSHAVSPVRDARSSLVILEHLCEQSQWTWTEGILILGCLQYAVEQYADALQCFSRITALDPR
ncbi:UDP-N-acetylglucosaminyltransferase [Cordyceps javanica]|uniref:UDP-N-acetylglucosaminyltransferase n=1 Tax=Cordyceps javanica TaxID=43265 RepID=A0A545VBP3_9HYPO|nr:UDP-N-acetylglucosaminyltransferase [Cordyceps javanica]TQW11186.1 UDP-N-acetylglucosaminyltransferase [Cordyceps javanica]